MTERLIFAGENPQVHNRLEAGGKGHNLLWLYKFAQESELFEVPDFFIIPTDAKTNILNPSKGEFLTFNNPKIKMTFEALRKPVIVRSSSPLEDGVNASFAGMFTSVKNVMTYAEFCSAAHQVLNSADDEDVLWYAKKMNISPTDAMALIVQEQIKGHNRVVQLYPNKGILECISERSSTHELEYRSLDELFPTGFKWKLNPNPKQRDWISEGEDWYTMYCAREAQKYLNLDFVTQAELAVRINQLPAFFQIRQLPKVKKPGLELKLDIPEGVPFIESQVCNDVPGEVILPAYVTFSQCGFPRIITETGQTRYDARSDAWMDKSNLFTNHDFETIQNLSTMIRIIGHEEALPKYEGVWAKGNSLFQEYILVCDKLDESYVAMARATTGKKAIITCLEAKKTSHAMTVARDLGIPAMGVNGNIMDLDSFYNQAETGDLIHMKSNGRRAVAYIQKKRESDPYERA
jgi:phosphohistidine swiveling domain-containing protein